MIDLAIVGAGPAGFYTAEAAVKRWGGGVRIDIIDAMPVPYGLVRSGVAPDHQSIKAVSKRYERTALSEGVRFIGNVRIGDAVSIEELLRAYHAVVLATGAPEDRSLDLPGAELTNVFGSAAFVGWYNGHPRFAGLDPDLSGRHAVVIGMGNVALDVARILSKTEREFAGSDISANALRRLGESQLRTITILARRGPHQIRMTPKELGELGELERARPSVDPADLPPEDHDDTLDPGLRKAVRLLRSYADPVATKGGAVAVAFDFFASPIGFDGARRVEQVEVAETRLQGDRAVLTGRKYALAADIVISCIGYRTAPIPGVPFDEANGRFSNEDGRIAPGLYCVGWARRGPSGTIGTNRPDGFALVDTIATDLKPCDGDDREGGAFLDRLATERGLDMVTFRDWQRIEAAEIAAARQGAPREKFVDIADMLHARRG